ncbi:hypothetical protein NDU88_004720 [Pleurodeles waltl]|uniref:Uncharacterized protein n=1 Tax=Pleurodeles waltl TaxID=8319 RepID=A0AAV7T8K1_PLEWA|nr:hypothetical protein NDU88_004720 [Pleurodeles waltl]
MSCFLKTLNAENERMSCFLKSYEDNKKNMVMQAWESLNEQDGGASSCRLENLPGSKRHQNRRQGRTKDMTTPQAPACESQDLEQIIEECLRRHPSWEQRLTPQTDTQAPTSGATQQDSQTLLSSAHKQQTALSKFSILCL